MTMQLKEKNYQFRQLMNQVHLPGRRDPAAVPADGEVVVDQTWQIAIGEHAADLTVLGAKDLQDYFFTSMDLTIPLRRYAGRELETLTKALVLAEKSELDKLGQALATPRSYLFSASRERVIVCGNDSAGVAQGGYYLEDLMNLREAPFLSIQRAPVERKPLFAPRMVHSGWGIDQFPDAHLHAMAHAGFDSVLLFVKGVDETTVGYLDFNDLIDRAEKFGLGVYFYSYLNASKHPDEKDADEYFDRVYGAVFRHAPRARGIILVGESCRFPSKDPHVAPFPAGGSDSGVSRIADGRVWEGFWPCYDYPKWVNAVKKAVRRYAPKADIVFWTYNWGWAPKEERLKLIGTLPKDISLEVTFEMFEQIEYQKFSAIVPDYTISFAGPGSYFTSEAAAAKKRNLPLYAMTNTGGMTWDVGVVPYIPTPQQWFKRYAQMHHARKQWNLSGLMDSHHYGWYPSPVSECAKWSFWSPEVDLDEKLRQIAARDFSQKAAPLVVKAWELWSKALSAFTPSNEDQYGPLRVGPSYPLVFHPTFHPYVEHKLLMPEVPYAHFGNHITFALYEPNDRHGQTAVGRRVSEEARLMAGAIKIWAQGVALMEKALTLTPERKLARAAKMAGVGSFFLKALITTLHCKEWWLLNRQLLVQADFARAGKILDRLEEVAAAELANAQDTIPLVEADSRLGWEPSMEYMTDRNHLEWKIGQVKNLLERVLPDYRQTLRVKPLKNGV